MDASQTSQESQLHLFDYFRVISVRWPLILLIFLLVVISTTAVTLLLPKQYESTALIQVQENADFEIFQQGRNAGWNPKFVSTQFEILQSRDILQPVVEKLELDQKWADRYEIKSPELIFEKLESIMTLRELRNTDLISISILSRYRKNPPRLQIRSRRNTSGPRLRCRNGG